MKQIHIELVNRYHCFHLGKCSLNVLCLSKYHALIEPDVLFPDEPEAGVCHLDAPVSRLLQLPGDSGELVS